MLCCAVLCCAVLCCAVQCCPVQCCAESLLFAIMGSMTAPDKAYSPIFILTPFLFLLLLIHSSVLFTTSNIHYFELQALQLYVEKVVVFTQANPVKDLGPECSAVLAEYAGLLASQGRLDVASTYLKGVTTTLLY